PDVDLAADVLPRVADEAGRRDRGSEAAVRDLAGELLHLRRGGGDVDRRHLTWRMRIGRERGHVRAPRVAVVVEPLAGEDAPRDRHRVAHGPEGLLRLRLRVVEEDLRRPE